MAETSSNQAINIQLEDAINNTDVEKTKELLEKGADPNKGLVFIIKNISYGRKTIGTKRDTPKLYDILELLIDSGASLQTLMYPSGRRLAQVMMFDIQNIDLLDFFYKRNPELFEGDPELFEGEKRHQYSFQEPMVNPMSTNLGSIQNVLFYLYGLANDLVDPRYTKYVYKQYGYHYPHGYGSISERFDEISYMRQSISEALPILANYIDFRKEKGKQKIIYNFMLKVFTKEEIAKIFEDLYLAYPSFNRRAPLLAHRERYIKYGNIEFGNNNNASLNNSTKTGGRRKKSRSTKTRRRHK